MGNILGDLVTMVGAYLDPLTAKANHQLQETLESARNTVNNTSARVGHTVDDVLKGTNRLIKHALGKDGEIVEQCKTKHGTATVRAGDGLASNPSLVINGNGRTLYESNTSRYLPGLTGAALRFCEDGSLPKLFKDWETSTGWFSSTRDIEGPGGKFSMQKDVVSGYTTAGFQPDNTSLISKFLNPSQVMEMASDMGKLRGVYEGTNIETWSDDSLVRLSRGLPAPRDTSTTRTTDYQIPGNGLRR
jgi:hypothetical protein